VVGTLTLDAHNALNLAPWENINAALRDIEVPVYLLDIVDAYLSDRNIQYLINDEMRGFMVERDIPQGSVIEHCLWNVMYNGLLKEKLPDGVKIINNECRLCGLNPDTPEHADFECDAWYMLRKTSKIT